MAASAATTPIVHSMLTSSDSALHAPQEPVLLLEHVVWPIQFYHTGWPSPNDHFRISNTCWAMYLRILRRSLEHGEQVPYERRLDV